MNNIQIKNLKYTLYLLITVFGWGIMYPSSKHAVSSGIDGYYLTLIRYVLGAILVSFVLFFTEGKKSFKTEGKTLNLWLFGTVGFAGLALYNYIDYCCILNLHLGGFNGHVTFSVTLPQQILTELKKEKLEQYLCPLILFNLKK